MDDHLTLIGFRYSVYTRIVRMALIEAGLEADYLEVDPFCETQQPTLLKYTPFGRVPVLRNGSFTLTETSAIVGYLNDLSAHPIPRPSSAEGVAQMAQTIGIIDAYGYQALIRSVFSHGFYRPKMNEVSDREKVVTGLVRSEPVLRQLDKIAAEGLQSNGQDFSLVDIHLAPMIAYFTLLPEAEEMLFRFPALTSWWQRMRNRPSLNATDPFSAL